jgi:hypothetical protein
MLSKLAESTWGWAARPDRTEQNDQRRWKDAAITQRIDDDSHRWLARAHPEEVESPEAAYCLRVHPKLLEIECLQMRFMCYADSNDRAKAEPKRPCRQ